MTQPLALYPSNTPRRRISDQAQHSLDVLTELGLLTQLEYLILIFDTGEGTLFRPSEPPFSIKRKVADWIRNRVDGELVEWLLASGLRPIAYRQQYADCKFKIKNNLFHPTILQISKEEALLESEYSNDAHQAAFDSLRYIKESHTNRFVGNQYKERFTFNFDLNYRTVETPEYLVERLENAFTIDRTVPESEKKALKRALKLAKKQGRYDDVRIIVNGGTVTISSPESKYYFTFTRFTKSTQFGKASTRPFRISLHVKENDLRLTSVCVFLEQTPNIDQFLALAMYIETNGELELLKSGIWYDKDPKADEWLLENDLALYQAYMDSRRNVFFENGNAQYRRILRLQRIRRLEFIAPDDAIAQRRERIITSLKIVPYFQQQLRAACAT